MVGTIGFAGSKARQNSRYTAWWLRLGLPHAALSALGGGLVGGLLGLAGVATADRLTQDARVWAGVAVVGLMFIAEGANVPAKILGRARQVPMSWKHTFPAPMSAALYGFTLGTGVLSTAYFWSFWALLVLIVGSADPVVGIGLGAVYGLSRTAPILASAVVSSDQVDSLIDTLYRHPVAIRLVSMGGILVGGIGYSARTMVPS
jgi:hypothetical protein